jgi:predicted restriction endonuclease
MFSLPKPGRHSQLKFGKPPSRAAEKQDRDRRTEADWLGVRRQVLARDGWACRACGVKRLVEVHHLKPRSLGRSDTLENLVTLCRIHHADRHAGRLAIIGTDANETLIFSEP